MSRSAGYKDARVGTGPPGLDRHPLFDEEETIPRLCAALDDVVAKLEAAGRPTEVIDHRRRLRDGSFARLKEAPRTRPWLRLVRFRRNFGQTAAMAAGFERARGDVHRPDGRRPAERSRGHPDCCSPAGGGLRRRLGLAEGPQGQGAVAASAVEHRQLAHRRVTGVPLHDYGCTLKAYRREVLEPVRLYGEMHRFIPIYAKWSGARVTEQVVRHHPRPTASRSTASAARCKVMLDLMTVKFLGDYSTKPMYMFGRWGFLFMALGVVSGIVTLVEKCGPASTRPPQPAAAAGRDAVLVGMQLIGMGLLAELQVRTYHESQHKPVYLVAEEVNSAETLLRCRGAILRVSRRAGSSAPRSQGERPSAEGAAGEGVI